MAFDSFIPSLAAALADFFPEMEGRFIAVSEIEPFDATNVPTLPIGFVALVSEKGAGTGNITMNDDVLVHFAFEPVKYKTAAGQDTPFFAFYDYEPIRDKIVAFSQSWRSPRNGGLAYKSMDIEASPFAVYISFRFEAAFKWCIPDELAAKPVQFDIVARTRLAACTIPCVKPEPAPPHPCAQAREAGTPPNANTPV